MGEVVPLRRYDQMTDEELVARAQKGNREATGVLLRKHKRLVLIISRNYFTWDSDQEDMAQEGMIGLFQAIRDFCPDYGCSFEVFASRCIAHHMITAVKISRTKQQQFERGLVLPSQKTEITKDWDEEDFDLENMLPEPGVEELYVRQIRAGEILEVITSISTPLEFMVLDKWLEGYSYQEIAEILKITPKSVDNAIRRAQNKIKKFCQEHPELFQD